MRFIVRVQVMFMAMFRISVSVGIFFRAWSRSGVGEGVMLSLC